MDENMRRIPIPHGELCYICGLIAQKAERNQGIFTGKYLCIICYSRKKNKDYLMKNKDKINKERRAIRNWRNGQLDPHSNLGKGFISEQIVCITLGLRNCNIETDNWNSHTDIDKHEKYGYISVKGANIKRGEWHFSNTGEGIFDTLIIICMGSNKNIERVYAIPAIEAKIRNTICIYKNPCREGWYEKYRIDESPFDITYHNMKLSDCKILRH
jgi:hypothetical protein